MYYIWSRKSVNKLLTLMSSSSNRYNSELEKVFKPENCLLPFSNDV